MGSYLSQPVTVKESESGSGGGFDWGSSCMQGWRVNMEDAHFAATGLQLGPSGANYSLFGVFDGHGGREVAMFCEAHVPAEVQHHLQTLCAPQDRKGPEVNAVAEALVRTFHAVDDMLRRPEHEQELLSMKKPAGGQVQDRLQAAITSDMARARDRGAISTKEAMRIAMGMSVLQRLEGSAAAPAGPQSAAPQSAAQNVGCTAVCVAITDAHVVCANAGDSRAVLCRGGRAIALSRDHKPNDRGERRRIEAAGGMVKEITAASTNGRTGRTQYRVNGDLNLSRAIGDLRHKTRADLRPDQQVVCSTPDVHIEAREPDDEFVVVACDGVWDVRTNAQVCDFVRQGIREGRELQVIIEDLLDACLSHDPKATQGLGADNMTCLVAKFPGFDAGSIHSPRRGTGLCLPFRCLR